MKVFFISILALGCAATLIMGQLHWAKKTKVEGKQADSYVTKASNAVKPVETKPVKSEDGRKPIKELLSLAENWPEESKKVLKEAYTAGRPFTILIAGSNSLGNGQESWPELVKQQLIRTYGDKVINVKVAEYDMTTKEFVDEKKQDELAGDMIIFEPLTLNDNGVLISRDSIANIKTIIKDVQTQNERTQFVLTPPQPLYNAKYYPVQVDELKSFATAQDIPYLDHWAAWPDYKSEEIKDYLSNDRSEPSVKGHEVWAKYVTDYLIKE